MAVIQTQVQEDAMSVLHGIAAVVCDASGCAKNGEAFNLISFPVSDMEPDRDAFFESWRGGDAADNCPACGLLGTLVERGGACVAVGVSDAAGIVSAYAALAGAIGLDASDLFGAAVVERTEPGEDVLVRNISQDDEGTLTLNVDAVNNGRAVSWGGLIGVLEARQASRVVLWFGSGEREPVRWIVAEKGGSTYFSEAAEPPL